jgi:hypothetical protein
MKLIINKTDFVGRVELPSNLGNEKINQHILHSQDFDLCKLMGDSFFYYFMSNFDSAGVIEPSAPQAIKDLYNGVSYNVNDIEYESAGVKPVLVYFSAARLIKAIGNHITPNGFAQKNNEFSEPVSNGTKVFQANEYENQAIAYWNKCLLYMSNNKDLFPQFYVNDCGCSNGRSAGKRPTTIAVGGRDNVDYYRRSRYGR